MVPVRPDRASTLGAMRPVAEPGSGIFASAGEGSFNYALSLAEIKKRGRWSSDKSVGRYERHAKLIQQANKVSAETWRAAKRARLSIRKDAIEAASCASLM